MTPIEAAPILLEEVEFAFRRVQSYELGAVHQSDAAVIIPVFDLMTGRGSVFVSLMAAEVATLDAAGVRNLAVRVADAAVLRLQSARFAVERRPLDFERAAAVMLDAVKTAFRDVAGAVIDEPRLANNELLVTVTAGERRLRVAVPVVAVRGSDEATLRERVDREAARVVADLAKVG